MLESKVTSNFFFLGIQSHSTLVSIIKLTEVCKMHLVSARVLTPNSSEKAVFRDLRLCSKFSPQKSNHCTSLLDAGSGTAYSETQTVFCFFC